MIQVSETPLSPQQVRDSLKTAASGSIVIHIGVVRPSSSEGKPVASVKYLADRAVAEDEFAHIAAEIRARWEIEDTALWRRLGKLDLGAVILVAAVSAPHRQAAFEACQHAVERIRNMATLKKHEILAG